MQSQPWNFKHSTYFIVRSSVYHHSDDLYSSALFILVFSLCLQAFVHICVNVQLLPITGLTLPFFSYGGSSLVSSFVVIGFCKVLINGDRSERHLLKGSESGEV